MTGNETMNDKTQDQTEAKGCDNPNCTCENCTCGSNCTCGT